MLLSVFLDSEARLWADVEICRDDEALYILAEGVSSADMIDYLNDCRPLGNLADVRDMSQSHRMVSLEGAYAWELLAELVGPEVMGLPYLTFFESEGFTCFRSGKTGEYGYYLLAPADEALALHEKLRGLGQRFDVADVELAAMDQCALENGFLCMRTPGITRYNPIELQLQWRVSYRKSYVGSDALLAIRERGVSQRVSHVISDAQLRAGDDVFLEDDKVGTVLQAGYSGIRGEWVGLTMLGLEYAYPGVRVLRAGDARNAIITASAPLINNRSIYVNSQNHTYTLRHEENYPPLMLDSAWVDSIIKR